MTKTISASQAKTNFGTLLSLATKEGDEFIIESYGQPKAALLPFGEYQKIANLRRDAERREVWAQLESLRQKIRKRNRDLTVKEANRLADRFTREVIDEMVKEKKITFR